MLVILENKGYLKQCQREWINELHYVPVVTWLYFSKARVRSRATCSNLICHFRPKREWNPWWKRQISKPESNWDPLKEQSFGLNMYAYLPTALMFIRDVFARKWAKPKSQESPVNPVDGEKEGASNKRKAKEENQKERDVTSGHLCDQPLRKTRSVTSGQNLARVE